MVFQAKGEGTNSTLLTWRALWLVINYRDLWRFTYRPSANREPPHVWKNNDLK